MNNFNFEGYQSSGTAAFVDYYWYLEHIDHSTQVSGHVSGTNTGWSSSLSVPGNNYRWGAYNSNGSAQEYQVCYV